MKQLPIAALFAVSLLLIGGCMAPTTPTKTIEETQTSIGDGHDTNSGSIDVYTQNITNTDAGFEFRARVTLNFYIEERTFSNVTLCLYDASGEVLNSTVIGDLSSPVDHEPASISANEIPKYIVVDHPAFHEYEKMAPRIFVHEKRGFRATNSYDTIDFEYPRPETEGICL